MHKKSGRQGCPYLLKKFSPLDHHWTVSQLCKSEIFVSA